MLLWIQQVRSSHAKEKALLCADKALYDTTEVVQCDIPTTCWVIMLGNPCHYIPLAENEIVTLLHEHTSFTQCCPQTRQSEHETITHGLYCIQWNAGCQMETADFFISGVDITVGHRKVEGWTLPQDAIDLIEHFKWNSYPTVLPPIIPLDLNLLPRPTFVHWAAGISYLTPPWD